MLVIQLIFSLCIAVSLTACADQADKKKAGMDITQFKWKNRIILSYPENEVTAAEQQKLIEQLQIQLRDRDLIILRVDEQQGDSGKELCFTEEQRLAVIKEYALTPGSHLLIGKDGNAKQKQSGELKLLLLFKQIDQMPMRKTEVQSKKSE
jgi:hypothetical protein